MKLNDVVMSKSQLIESYMVFGGIPLYLNMIDSRLSLTQNINELCFKDYGYLYNEYYNLMHSLYNKPEKHMAILEALSTRKAGLTRNELINNKQIGGGSVLTKDLCELEECGFIRKYSNCNRGGGIFYQVIDPFVLFSIRFLKNKKFDSWNEYINSPSYNAWRGNSFEIVCFNHIEQIKRALSISGIETTVYTWNDKDDETDAQIDLIIKRKDGVINLCESKFTNDIYSLDDTEHKKILNRFNHFIETSGTKAAIHVTLISANGYKQNKYSDVFQNVILGDDLFE